MELSMWQTHNFLEMVKQASASLPPMDRCEFQGTCASLISDDERIAELKGEVEELEEENKRLERENTSLDEKVDALKCDLETQETKLLGTIVELEGKVKELIKGKKGKG